jgi:hypothetical protein
MRFVPATLRVKQGEILSLVVRNTGAVALWRMSWCWCWELSKT